MKNNTQPALKERIEKALDDFTKGRASMHVPPLDTDVDMVLAECSERLSELEARCAALAAENAWLKGTLSAVIDRSNEPDYQSIGMGCGVEDNGLQTDGYNACEYGWREAMDRIYSEVIPDAIPEIPATDAVLAEVRAQGVESVGEYLKQYAQGLHEEARLVLQDAGELCNGFAAQLRKGVQS